MALKGDFSSLRERLARVAARLDAHIRETRPRRTAAGKGSLLDSIYENLRDLFTVGVTREGLRDLVQTDAREAFRFYTRGVDLESLRPLPWFQRFPATAWRVFVALAYRLSPARRIIFILAVFLALIGWIEIIVYVTRWGPPQQDSGVLWLFLSFALILLLLLLELRDKLDLKGDLEIAREIQFGLIPSGPYQLKGIGIHCHMRPANTVGGDYCDIIQLSEDRVGIVVGDVAGKGIPAALLMALLQGSLRTLIAAGHRGSELIGKLNAYLYENIPENRLVTLFYGEVDAAAGSLHYVNAGHNAPVLIRSGANLERLPATCTVLGIDKSLEPEALDAELGPGSRLLLFTDGITEAFNPKGEEYGESRLAAFIQANQKLHSAELIRSLVADVLKFCGAAHPSDDMTLMLVTRNLNHEMHEVH